jgi:hypothetical protein
MGGGDGEGFGGCGVARRAGTAKGPAARMLDKPLMSGSERALEGAWSSEERVREGRCEEEEEEEEEVRQGGECLDARWLQHLDP